MIQIHVKPFSIVRSTSDYLHFFLTQEFWDLYTKTNTMYCNIIELVLLLELPKNTYHDPIGFLNFRQNFSFCMILSSGFKRLAVLANQVNCTRALREEEDTGRIQANLLIGKEDSNFGKLFMLIEISFVHGQTERNIFKHTNPKSINTWRYNNRTVKTE